MIIHAATFNNSGYGKVARSILTSLPGINRIVSDDKIPDDLSALATTEKPFLTIAPPNGNSSAKVQFTMYESTKLPTSMVENLNKRELIIVPCEQNRKAFTASGVKSRIEVCHLGTTPKYKPVTDWTLFQFLHVSNDSGVPERKRTADIIEAFKMAFPTQDNVRLTIKKSPSCAKIPCFDNRIKLIYEDLKPELLENLYTFSHVGVFASGQEAWGYPHVELMSIGRPVIAPCFGGPAEYLNNTNGYLLPFKLAPTPKRFFNSIGTCADVNIKDIANALLFCYENKDDTILKGVMSYRTMLGFTYSRLSSRLSELLYANHAIPKISRR